MLSWAITFGCIYTVFEEVLFVMSPSVPTFFLYGNALEVLLTKVSLSLVISWWQVLPHAVFLLWLFLRPGLHKFESGFGPTGPTLLFVIVTSWLIYGLCLDFVSFTLQNLSSYYYRFLPSLSSTSSFIANLLMLSNCLALFPRIFWYFLHIGERIFVKIRLIVIYLAIVLMGWLLPPDISYLIMATLISATALESLYYVHLLYRGYGRLTQAHPPVLLPLYPQGEGTTL